MSVPTPSQASPRLAIRRVAEAFAERDDPYAGADRGNAVRITALILLLSGLLTAVYLPIEPPTSELGNAGWVVAGAVILASVAAGAVVRRRGNDLSWDALLAITYAGIAGTALLTWLSGGWFSPYSQILLLWIGAGTGIHPPRRAVTVIVASAVVLFLPAAYSGWSATGFEHVLSEFVIWALLGLIVLTLMTYVRAQRVAMRAQSSSAEALARVDPLTGLGNRRAFDETLRNEIGRARAGGSTLSVALLDLDGFKELNDRLGHLEGDRCLKEVAAGIERAKRADDHVFRWGGDEFAVILPGAAGAQANAAITRIASLEPSIAASDGRALTFCWGIAELEAGMTAGEILERADLDLFSRKRERPQSVERV